MNYYLDVLKKYAVFSGRANRKEYWYFFLFNIIISIVLSVIVNVIGHGANIISILYSLAVLVPSLAVAVRRLHDIGKSGWWILITLIPLVGPIWLIILLAMRSKTENNKYA